LKSFEMLSENPLVAEPGLEAAGELLDVRVGVAPPGAQKLVVDRDLSLEDRDQVVRTEEEGGRAVAEGHLMGGAGLRGAHVGGGHQRAPGGAGLDRVEGREHGRGSGAKGVRAVLRPGFAVEVEGRGE
jgi:hypothetical protein